MDNPSNVNAAAGTDEAATDDSSASMVCVNCSALLKVHPKANATWVECPDCKKRLAVKKRSEFEYEEKKLRLIAHALVECSKCGDLRKLDRAFCGNYVVCPKCGHRTCVLEVELQAKGEDSVLSPRRYAEKQSVASVAYGTICFVLASILYQTPFLPEGLNTDMLIACSLGFLLFGLRLGYFLILRFSAA